MKIAWSSHATERAYACAVYIANDKPSAALRWLDGLFEVVDRLETFPESGRVVPEIGLDDFRELVYQRTYRVVYRREKSRILILTVRNYAQILDLSELTTSEE